MAVKTTTVPARNILQVLGYERYGNDQKYAAWGVLKLEVHDMPSKLPLNQAFELEFAQELRDQIAVFNIETGDMVMLVDQYLNELVLDIHRIHDRTNVLVLECRASVHSLDELFYADETADGDLIPRIEHTYIQGDDVMCYTQLSLASVLGDMHDLNIVRDNMLPYLKGVQGPIVVLDAKSKRQGKRGQFHLINLGSVFVWARERKLQHFSVTMHTNCETEQVELCEALFVRHGSKWELKSIATPQKAAA